MNISAILLCGGQGKRMGSPTPKQYLPLYGKAVAQWSYELLASLPEIEEIIVVCHPDWQFLFPKALFAKPGVERQHSAANGASLSSSHLSHLLFHDSARPLLTKKDASAVIAAGLSFGAAALATPVTDTIKRGDSRLAVKETINRENLYRIQTPQVLEKSLYFKGLAKAAEARLICTDDTSLAELVGHPIQLVLGSELNIKITTPSDLLYAEALFQRNEVPT